MATPDLLFNLRNLFYLGAYQSAINNSDVPGLDADAAAERDVIVFRSYIALGSYQVSIVLHFPQPASPRFRSDRLGLCCCSW
jgi:coatomer protein complex subunit epsilon